MKKSRNQNPVYLVTTISVYLGLVLIGASPHVLSQGSVAGETQSRIFEFASKTNSVLSKLKLRQETVEDQASLFVLPGRASDSFFRWRLFNDPGQILPGTLEQPFIDEQVLTVSNLPRASI